MRKVFSKHKKGISYVKHPQALVQTEPPSGLKEFFNQRLRWAGKTKFKADEESSGLAVVMVGLYTFQFFVPVLLIFNFNFILLYAWLGSLALKTIADYWYFKPILEFYDRRNLLRYLIPTELFHLIYVVPIGILSLFAPYSWKGRTLYHGGT